MSEITIHKEADLAKRIAELEATLKAQDEVINDQIGKLELSEAAKKIQAETFKRDGKIYKINYGTLILPGVEKGNAKTVSAAEVAQSKELQDAFMAIEGFLGFEPIEVAKK